MSDQTLSTVQQQVGELSSNPPASFQNEENRAKAELIELTARQQFLSLRTNWSRAILVWISCSLFLQWCLILFVGLDKLNFEKYRWFLPGVLFENFAQIVTMGLVIVRFLYHPDGSPKRFEPNKMLANGDQQV